MDYLPVAKKEKEEREEDEDGKVGPLYRQMFGAAPPILNIVCGGSFSGFSAILLPQLDSDTSTIKVTKEEASWIASVVPLFMAVGCFCGGYLTERFGRKKMIIFGATTMAVCWISVSFTTIFGSLLVARIASGISFGLCAPSNNVYLAEIANPKNRSTFIGFLATGIAMGLFLSHILGTFLTWQTTALILTVPCVLSVGIMWKAPESHVWLLKKERVQEAKMSFVWFRGQGVEAKEELAALLSQPVETTQSLSFKDKIKYCCRRSFIRPFLVGVIFFAVQQLSGHNAIEYYSITVMIKAVPGLNGYLSTFIIDLVRILITLTFVNLTRKYPSRFLAILSTLGCAISLLVVVAFLHVASLNPRTFFDIVPILPMSMYIVFFGIGLWPLSWVLGAELLPTSGRGIGNGLLTFVNFSTYFLVVKTGPILFEAIGTKGAFSTYALFLFVGAVLMYFYQPETRNKTLSEIEEYFAK